MTMIGEKSKEPIATKPGGKNRLSGAQEKSHIFLSFCRHCCLSSSGKKLKIASIVSSIV